MVGRVDVVASRLVLVASRRPAVGVDVVVCSGGALGALSASPIGSEWVWRVAAAAGYGVGHVASCCMACRAVEVAASGVRAVVGQAWK